MDGDTGTKFAYRGDEFAAMDGAANYYRWIRDRFAPWLDGHVLEIGAGVGNFSAHVLDVPTVEALTLVEPAKNLVPALCRRFEGDSRVTVLDGYFGEVDVAEPVDSIVLVNVLEHVERDADLVRLACDLLSPGGSLLVYVPAVPWLYGSLDEAFDHRRRYTKGSLTKVLVTSGYTVHDLRYVNLPGVAAWFAAGRVLRRESLGGAAVGWYDRWVVPVTARIESVVPPPIGQNLLAVARRPDDEEKR